jgi:glycosyltransferase involved in cell wall biosynthesis
MVFPTSSQTGRWGFGRVKSLLDWLAIPLLVLYGFWIIKSNRLSVIVTIAHGHFFVAAGLLSRITGTPLVLIVHDDWVAAEQRASFVLKHFSDAIFQFVARQAAHVYAVTPYMGEMLATSYGVVSEVQMPAIETEIDNTVPARRTNADECLRIIYAGTLTGATDDSFNLFVDLVKGDKLLSYGITSWELLLYVLAAPEQVIAAGWQHERIKVKGWVSQEELKASLTTADILFLPFSFRDDERFATAQAFPSKTADYLKSGKPILIFAPHYSSLVRYAKEFGFAEIVDQPDEDKLAQSIARIWKSDEYRRELAANSRTTLNANHEISKQRQEFKALLNELTHESAEVAISRAA